MANIKSAIKRAKVTQTKNLRNRVIISKVRTAIKCFNAAVVAGDITKAQSLFPKTVSIVDKACSKGVMHKNAANRKKAQLSTKIAKAQ